MSPDVFQSKSTVFRPNISAMWMGVFAWASFIFIQPICNYCKLPKWMKWEWHRIRTKTIECQQFKSLLILYMLWRVCMFGCKSFLFGFNETQRSQRNTLKLLSKQLLCDVLLSSLLKPVVPKSHRCVVASTVTSKYCLHKDVNHKLAMREP